LITAIQIRYPRICELSRQGYSQETIHSNLRDSKGVGTWTQTPRRANNSDFP